MCGSFWIKCLLAIVSRSALISTTIKAVEALAPGVPVGAKNIAPFTKL